MHLFFSSDGYKDFAITLINKDANTKRTLKVLSDVTKKQEEEEEKHKNPMRRTKAPRYGMWGKNNQIGDAPIISIFKYILQKDWMGLVYLILPTMDPLEAIHDALETENYHLGKFLLSTQFKCLL
jgi:hypothetical protein